MDCDVITKEILAIMVRQKLNYNYKDTVNLIESLINIISLELEKGNEVRIKNFGCWNIRHKREREVLLLNKDKYTISKRKVVTFKMADSLREALKDE